MITVVLELNNSASNSACLNTFHIATCGTLCLHRATLPGNTPCYVKKTHDELELTVEQHKAVDIKTPTPAYLVRALTASLCNKCPV